MRIVIVDDHPLVRKGLGALFSLENDTELVGEASGAREAVSLIEETNPDIALVDLRLGEECGFEIVEEQKCRGSVCKFIILTSSADEDDFKRAEMLEVDGYIMKEALPEELLYAVRLVSRGRKYFDPGLMELMMKKPGANPVDELTPREHEVLAALGKGCSNSQIAGQLFITEFTVKKHVSQILAKLGLADRTQAALYAHSKGLVLKST